MYANVSREQDVEKIVSRIRWVAYDCSCDTVIQAWSLYFRWFVDNAPQSFACLTSELSCPSHAIKCFLNRLSRLQTLGVPPQQLSCLHTSISLESKHWERRNLKVYPPQLPDEPRRPAVSLCAWSKYAVQSDGMFLSPAGNWVKELT